MTPIPEKSLGQRAKKRAVKLLAVVMPGILDDINDKLDNTLEAMERGEVKPEDLLWEAELDPSISRKSS